MSLSSIKLSPTATKFVLSPTLAANELAKTRRAQGLSVLQMGFGESPFPVPKYLDKALGEAAFRKDYVPCAGEEALRSAVATYYSKMLPHTNILDNFDVVIAPGSKLILYALQMAIEGDVLVPVPSWVSYVPQALMLKTRQIDVPSTLNDSGYRIDAKVLRDVIVKARAEGLNPRKIILNSPNNPTGQKIPIEDLKAVAAVCREEGIFIISDEIYSQIEYEEPSVDPLERYAAQNGFPISDSISQFAPDQTAITGGLSKHLSLGGWRLGVGLIPKSIPKLHSFICNIASETWSCVPAPIQQACVGAFDLENTGELRTHIVACTRIHSAMNGYIQKELSALGIHAPKVTGSFYNYPNFGPFRDQLKAKLNIETSEQLTSHLANTYGLIALPGVAFGEKPEVLSMRLSSCDYDGALALEKELAGTYAKEVGDAKFIAECAPNLVLQAKAFTSLVAELKKE